MNKVKLLSVGTSGMSNVGDRERVILVNTLCLVTASSILSVGGIICYYLHWRLSVTLAFSAEFLINGSVIFLNYYRKHLAASMVLYFLQCAVIVYYSILLGKLLRLDIVIVLMFAINYLIFKDKYVRRLAVAAALLDLLVLQIVYYYNPSITSISIPYTTAYIIQAVVIFVMTIITILVSMPYVRSNDTNEELKRANNLIKIFVAQVTHELRTPLDSIHQVMQLLRKDVQKDQHLRRIQPLVDIGFTVSCNARNIVNNVLDMAEIEAGKMPVMINEAFKVAPFFEKIADVNQIIARREEMTLDLRIDAGMPEVIFGDPLNINQILTNLLANAIKYGLKRGAIVVSVRKEGLTWALSVSNGGAGIPPGKLEAIFDPFVTGKKGHIQGSGLGLYIVKSKVALMNGSVQVESDPGRETTFTVLLPLREGKLRDLPDGAGVDTDAVDLDRVNVLVAEDDKLSAFLLARFLGNMGCAYTIVKNGQELLETALAACPANCPDIILVDGHMPVLNGEETIRALKQTPGLSHIPIIITTGDLYSDTVARMLAAGANAYVKKPIDHIALQKAMALYLKKLPQN